MAENGETPPEAQATPEAAAPQVPKLQVLGQFIRDCSFENIMVQKGVAGEITPEINVQVSMEAKKRPVENQYEVVTKYTVTSRNQTGQETLFILEIQYGGIFLIENVADEQLHPFLMIECPRMLFPFVRRLVADLTREGGFPPFNMETVDFVALYRQMIQQKAAEAKGQTLS